jgi:hypothetical protein
MIVLCSCVRIYLGSQTWSACLHAFSPAGNSISHLISSVIIKQARVICLLHFVIFSLGLAIEVCFAFLLLDLLNLLYYSE